MRKVPFLITECEECGNRIHLWEEKDFHAIIEDNGHYTFWYTCPECGANVKHPESLLPTFLKVKLIRDAETRKVLTDFITIGSIAILAGFFAILLILR